MNSTIGRDHEPGSSRPTKRRVRHGMSGTPEHRAWKGMMARCYGSKPGDGQYELYRGLGITVAEPWHDFRNFLADMGKKPSLSHSLDRYPNGSGNYGPGNCRWATATEQSNNRRGNKRFSLNGESLTATEWARRLGISRPALLERIKTGWPLERALTTPVLNKRCRGDNGQWIQDPAP